MKFAAILLVLATPAIAQQVGYTVPDIQDALRSCAEQRDLLANKANDNAAIAGHLARDSAATIGDLRKALADADADDDAEADKQ